MLQVAYDVVVLCFAMNLLPKGDLMLIYCCVCRSKMSSI